MDKDTILLDFMAFICIGVKGVIGTDEFEYYIYTNSVPLNLHFRAYPKKGIMGTGDAIGKFLHGQGCTHPWVPCERVKLHQRFQNCWRVLLKTLHALIYRIDRHFCPRKGDFCPPAKKGKLRKKKKKKNETCNKYVLFLHVWWIIHSWIIISHAIEYSSSDAKA